MKHVMPLLPLIAALVAALPLSADDKPKADTREIVGTDQVNVYWCPHKPDFWTQTADSVKACPYCEGGDSATCGKVAGDFKIVVKAGRGTVKAGSEATFDIEIFQIVVDKDAKPDEVRVMNTVSVKAKFQHGSSKDGDFVADDEGKVQDATIAGEKKIASVKVSLKKGEYKVGLEITRGDKEKTKIESEVTFRVD